MTNETKHTVQVGNVKLNITLRPRDEEAYWKMMRQRGYRSHDRDRPNGRARLYFSHESESIIENFGNRHARPTDFYKNLIPHVEKALGINLGHTKWDRKAGCSMCPCSPGFVCDYTSHDIWVSLSEEAPKVDTSKADVAANYSAALASDPTMPWNMKGNGKAIKGAEKYDRYVMEVPGTVFTVEKRFGKELISFNLRQGDEFFIRQATSAKGQYRVIFRETGASKVFSLDERKAMVLMAASKRSEKKS